VIVALFSFQMGEDQDRERIFFPVVWYGCGTWSDKMKEEYKLLLLGKRNLGKIFAP
jgi:hypothetical protein